MSKRFNEAMANWERENEEKDWRRRCWIASEEKNKENIQSLVDEGKENSYDIFLIENLNQTLEKL